MPYRIRYTVNIDWVGPGAGPMSAMNPTGGNLPGGGGVGQTLGIVAAPTVAGIVNGAGTGGAITSGDVTTLVSAMSSDVTAQLNLTANLSKMQAWISGNP